VVVLDTSLLTCCWLILRSVYFTLPYIGGNGKCIHLVSGSGIFGAVAVQVIMKSFAKQGAFI
jgi:hypothetical protein